MGAKGARDQAWFIVFVAAIALVAAAVLGLWGYIIATSKPLHPSAQAVPSVPGSVASPTWAGASEQGRQMVRAILAERNLPGLSVAVGVGGEIVWAEGFGWANLEDKTRVAPDTRFRIGTASTALTSAAVGLLLEKDRLNLDEKIQTYVPEFPQSKWPVTLRQLMGHVAGVRSDDGDEGPLFSAHCERPVDALQSVNANRDLLLENLLFEPGTRYFYSRYGWILVSAAVEAAAGEPFLTFMQKQIFEPLGMNDTRPDSEMESRATSYFPRFAADPQYGPDLMRPLDYSCYAGSSVFLSTPSDLVRFATAMSSGKLLQPATAQLLQTSQRLTSGEETGYGLGWDLETVELAGKKTNVVGHDGDLLGGMASSLMTFPEYGIAVAVTSNISYADTASIGLKIAQTFVEQGRNPAAAVVNSAKAAPARR